METKEQLMHQFSKTNPSTNSTGSENLKYERDKVFLEVLLDLRDVLSKVLEKKK